MNDLIRDIEQATLNNRQRVYERACTFIVHTHSNSEDDIERVKAAVRKSPIFTNKQKRALDKIRACEYDSPDRDIMYSDDEDFF